MYPYGFFLSLQKNNLVYLELMDCQVSDNGDYGVVLEAILDSCYSLQKLSFGTTDRLNLPLNLSIFYRICLQNGKSLKTLYMPSCKELDKIAITPDDQMIYCLSCDFKEHKPQDGSKNDAKPTEPKVFNIEDFRPKKS